MEQSVDNVRQATKDMRISYPVVIDNDHAIWRAFNDSVGHYQKKEIDAAMNRDLPTTGEDTRAHAVRAHSLTANLWWLLPPAAALFYPQAVRALYESDKLLHRASGALRRGLARHRGLGRAHLQRASCEYRRRVPAGAAQKNFFIGIAGLSPRAPGGSLSSAIRVDRSCLLFAALHDWRLRILVDPLADRPWGSGVGSARARHRRTCLLCDCARFSESGASSAA